MTLIVSMSFWAAPPAGGDAGGVAAGGIVRPPWRELMGGNLARCRQLMSHSFMIMSARHPRRAVEARAGRTKSILRAPKHWGFARVVGPASRRSGLGWLIPCARPKMSEEEFML